MNAIIIDDEEGARLTLKIYLSKYCPDVVVIGQADCLYSAKLLIVNLSPDLIFLDINLGDGSGISILDEKISKFITIFVTAYSEFAINAIHKGAIDYLLKPICIDDLIASVDKARRRLAEDRLLTEYGEIRSLLKRPVQNDKIQLPILDGFVYIDIIDIIRCEAENNYTIFHIINKNKLTICKNLGFYEEYLRDKGFVRIHNHHVINIAFVTRYQKGRGGVVFLSDGSELIVSQRRRDDFLKSLAISKF